MAYPKTQSESVAFRENFDSVASVIDNGGTPSNGAVIDKSFTGTGNGEVITYANNPLFSNFFSKERSVEVEFTASSVGESIGLIMGKEGGNTGWTIFLSDDTGSAAKLNFFQYFTTTDGKWRTVSAVITYGTRYTLGVTYDSSSTANNPVITLDGVVVSITEVFTPAGTADDDTAQAFKVGNTLATGQSFDGSVYGVSLYFSAKTTEEFLDITEQDTFEEIDDSKFLLSLPLRTYYNDGANLVTDNIGSLGGQVTWGDGSSGATNPTQLSPKGVTTDGTAEYLWEDGTNLDITQLQITGDVTFGGLVRLNSAPALAFATILGQLVEGESLATNVLYQVYVNANRTLGYQHEYDSGTNQTNDFTTALSIGSWTSVYLVRDVSALTVDLYVNGEFAEQYVYTNQPAGGTSTQLVMGNNIGFAPDRFAPISIIQPRVGAFAATPTQIKELANRDLRMINN